MKKFYLIIFMVMFFVSAFGQENDAQTTNSENDEPFNIPDIASFHHNKIAPVNAVNPEIAIFNTVNITATQLVTATISLDEQSLVLAPLHFKQRKLQVFDWAIKAALKDNITYLGTGFKLRIGNGRFNGIYRRNKAKYTSLFNSLDNMTNPTVKRVEMEKFIKLYKNNFIKDVNRQFNKNNFTIHGSGTALLFQSSNDSLADNTETLKGFNASGGASVTFSEKVGVHFNYNYSERKANATENATSVAYNGFSATLSKLFTFNDDYIESENYWLHSFIPGLEVALVFEYEEAFNNFEFAENGIVNETSIGIVFDIKINPKMQLRLGLPYKMTEFANNATEDKLNAVIQYNLQIGNF